MNTSERTYKNPFLWVPTSYFAMGTVYVTLTTASNIMFRNLGLSNEDAAWYSSLLGWPYVVKFLWAPLLEIYKTKKFFVVLMQFLLAAILAGVAFVLPLPNKAFVYPALVLLMFAGIAGATMDIGTDGVYVTTLPPAEQSRYTGWQSTCWSIGPIIASGLLVSATGYLKQWMPYSGAWMVIYLGIAAVLAIVGFAHIRTLPTGAKAKDAPESFGAAMRTFGNAFETFFVKENATTLVALLSFALLYRVGLGLLDKMGPLFLIDSRIAGGIGLNNVQLGNINGTVGTAAFLIGSVLGGLFVAKLKLRRALLILCLCLNLPNFTFLYLGLTTPDNVTNQTVLYLMVFIEKFGWGFGAVGHMIFMMQQIAPGPYKTAHYAIATGLMGLCMMGTGMVSGVIQADVGYQAFFIIVLVFAAPSLLATLLAPFIYADDSAPGQEAQRNPQKMYVLGGAARWAAVAFVLVLAGVGSMVAKTRSEAFRAERANLRNDAAACANGGTKACYYRCELGSTALADACKQRGPADPACAELAKQERAPACHQLAETFRKNAEAARPASAQLSGADKDKYVYQRYEQWKWYEKELQLLCDVKDATSCMTYATIVLDPERAGWQEKGVLEGIVNKDENTAKSYFKKACDAGEQTACGRS